MNYHLDFELAEYNYKRWNFVSTSEWKSNKRKDVRQPQLIPTIINRYAVLDNLQSEWETPHYQNWVKSATFTKKKSA
jgi:hypothetical protein